MYQKAPIAQILIPYQSHIKKDKIQAANKKIPSFDGMNCLIWNPSIKYTIVGNLNYNQ